MTDGKYDYEVVFRSMPVAVQIMDCKFTVIDATEEYLRVTLRERDDIVGRYVFDAFPAPPGTGDNLLASFHRVLDTGRPHRLPPFVYPVQSLTGDAETMHWRVINAPMCGRDGAIVGVINMVEDMTEIARRETERQELVTTLAATLAGISTSADQLRRALELSTQPHPAVHGAPVA